MRKTMAGVVLVAITVLFGWSVASAGMLGGLFEKDAAARAKEAGVTETADSVTIPTKALESGKALFLAYESGGRTVRWFALRCKDGYRVALDACDVCWRADKGYGQEGGEVICRNCRMRFKVEKIGQEKGGCNPHPLPFKVEGGNVVVPKSDLAAGERFFPAKK